MKAIISLLICVLLLTVLWADDTPMGLIRGKVIDEDGIGLQYVNVVFFQGDTRVTGAQSDNNGRFSIKIPAGSYLASLRCIGLEQIDSLVVTVVSGDTTTLPSTTMHRIGLNDDFWGYPSGKLIVHVKDKMGRSLENVLVVCSPGKQEETYENKTNADGLLKFKLRTPLQQRTPLSMSIRFHLDGYETVKLKKVIVKGQETTRLEVTLKKTRKTN